MKRSSVLFVVACALVTSACGWPVRAIDRGRLAHPTMKTEDLATGMDGHVRAVSEGATGGVAGGGGGCGCN